jgi:hypothetical protein
MEKSPPFHSHHRGARRTGKHDQRVAIGDRAGCITSIVLLGAVLLDEVVRPRQLPRLLVDGEHLDAAAHRKHTVAQDERRRMRPCALAQIQTLCRFVVAVFPHALSRRRIERRDALGTAMAIHRVEAAAFDQNRRMALAQRS